MNKDELIQLKERLVNESYNESNNQSNNQNYVYFDLVDFEPDFDILETKEDIYEQINTKKAIKSLESLLE